MSKYIFSKGVYNGIIRKTSINKDGIYIEVFAYGKNGQDAGFACFLNITMDNILGLMDTFACNWESIDGKYCCFKVNKKGRVTKIGHIMGNGWFDLKSAFKSYDKNMKERRK